MSRPRCHVVMSVKMTSAIASGTQPPCTILSMFAEKKARSITRKKAVSSPARQTLHCQCDRAST